MIEARHRPRSSVLKSFFAAPAVSNLSTTIYFIFRFSHHISHIKYFVPNIIISFVIDNLATPKTPMIMRTVVCTIRDPPQDSSKNPTLIASGQKGTKLGDARVRKGPGRNKTQIWWWEDPSLFEGDEIFDEKLGALVGGDQLTPKRNRVAFGLVL